MPPECCACDSDLDSLMTTTDLTVYHEEAAGGCANGGPTTLCDADCTMDGIVNIDDLMVIGSSLGRLCGGCAHSLPLHIPPTGPAWAACANGLDDDGDGYVDYAEDLGCDHPFDTTEQGPLPPV